MSCEVMLQTHPNETRHIWSKIPFHIWFPNARVEKKNQRLMPFLYRKNSLRPNFHTTKMQNKHGLPDKNIFIKVICLVLQADDFAERKRILAVFGELHLFVKIACEFLSCDKDLISDNKSRLSMRRSLMTRLLCQTTEKNIVSFKSGRQTYIGANWQKQTSHFHR